MYKELIKIIDQNLQHLKCSLGITEAHITWGTKDVKKKYSKIKINILNKMKEEKAYRKEYQNKLQSQSTSIQSTVYKKQIPLSDYFKKKIKEGYWKVNQPQGLKFV